MQICRFFSACGLLVMTAMTLTSSGCHGVQYDSYPVLEITDLIKFLENSEVDVRRPSHGSGDPAHVMVSPEKVSFFKDYVQSLGLNAPTGMTDNIDLLNRSGVAKFRFSDVYETEKQRWGDLDWVHFYALESINAYLERVANHSRGLVKLIRMGKTANGHDLVGVRIAYSANLPVVFITAGVHGNEWIGTATATWLIGYMLKVGIGIARAYEWHVFPVVNPDGYDFTRTLQTWHKNRRQYVDQCLGVDLNRNWPFQWVLNEACSRDFGGPESRSEIETSLLIGHMIRLEGRIRVYMNLRDFGQRLLYPWAYAKKATEDDATFQRIGAKVRHDIGSTFGSVYTYGTVANVTEEIGGTIIDYAYKYLGIKYPFEYWHRHKTEKESASDYIRPMAVELLDVLIIILQEELELQSP